MSVMHPPDSEFAKEMIKWEAQGSTMGPGLRPYQRHAFPAWVYRAKREDGKIVFEDPLWVESQVQASNAYSRGYHPDPEAASKGLQATELEIAKQAANRAHHEQRMSPKARAEVAAVEEETSGHLASMPETPIRRRRGRPAKAKPTTETAA